MSVGATVTVLYPAKEGVTFDLEYYQTKHMPLVLEKWGPLGMKQAIITDLRHTDQPYIIQATLHWDSVESIKKASAVHGAEVMGDVVNFYSDKPVVVTGTVIQNIP